MRKASSSKGETVMFSVSFSLADGKTQNFSIPIYSGTGIFSCLFKKKRDKVSLLLVPNSLFLHLLLERQDLPNRVFTENQDRVVA
jgi:hypothetical protein